MHYRRALEDDAAHLPQWTDSLNHHTWTSRTPRECKCRMFYIIHLNNKLHYFNILSLSRRDIAWKSRILIPMPSPLWTKICRSVFICSYCSLITCFLTFSSKSEQIQPLCSPVCRHEANDTSPSGESLEALLSNKSNFRLLSRSTEQTSCLITAVFKVKLCCLV